MAKTTERRLIGSERWTRRPLPGFAHAERAPLELDPVQLLDGLRHGRCITELNERESARASGVAIGGQENFNHRANLRAQRLEVCL